MGTREYNRLRRVALHLPEVREIRSHGAPCFFVRGKRPIGYFHDHHNGDDRISLWCPAGPGVQETLVGDQPKRFFKPPTSSSGTFSGWLGMYLDHAGGQDVNWDQIAALLEDAFRIVAPKSLIAELDERQPKAL